MVLCVTFRRFPLQIEANGSSANHFYVSISAHIIWIIVEHFFLSLSSCCFIYSLLLLLHCPHSIWRKSVAGSICFRNAEKQTSHFLAGILIADTEWKIQVVCTHNNKIPTKCVYPYSIRSEKEKEKKKTRTKTSSQKLYRIILYNEANRYTHIELMLPSKIHLAIKSK